MAIIHVNVPYRMLAERIGFAVENRIYPEIYFSAEDLDTSHESEVKGLADKLHAHSLEVTLHAPFMDLSPGGVDRRIKEVTIDRFTQLMQWASHFRPKTIVFHPGYEKWKFDGNVDLWLASSLETWRPLVRRAQDLGLILVLENVFEESPEPLKRLLGEVESPYLRFCFDTGHYHAFTRGHVPLADWFNALGPYMVEVHLHDNHQEMDDHLPMGEGNFDFDLFFRLLSQFHLKPIFTLEPHSEDHLWRGLEAAKRYIK